MTFEFTYAVDDKGREYCTIPGAKTPTSYFGFSRLSKLNYIDHNGVEHEEPTPEGFMKTETVAWRAKKEYLEGMISELKEDTRYHVFIYEV